MQPHILIDHSVHLNPHASPIHHDRRNQMTMITKSLNRSRAFTLIELIVIIVVLAILSGVAIPKYIDYTANAKASSAKATIGAVRSAIANFYSSSAITGAAAFPTLVQLGTLGTVMQEALPANPYNSDAT